MRHLLRFGKGKNEVKLFYQNVKIIGKRLVYLRKKLYVSTVIGREMNEIIEKIAERVAKGMKPTKVQMRKLHALPMEWNEREALVKKTIEEKRAEVAAKRAEILRAMSVRREWETVGEEIPHNIKF